MEWKPIESAPRDGTEIIVLIVAGGVPIVRTAWWREMSYDQSMPDADGPDDVGWWSYRHCTTQEMLVGYEAPQRWMPLPPGTNALVRKIL